MLKPDEMNSFLQVLTIFRNACAHDERLYNLKAMRRSTKPNSIRTMPIHTAMGLPFGPDGNPVCCKNDLFAIVIIFKTMLSKSSFNTFIRALKKQLEVLDKALTTINIAVVKDAMGFPANWETIRTV